MGMQFSYFRVVHSVETYDTGTTVNRIQYGLVDKLKVKSEILCRNLLLPHERVPNDPIQKIRRNPARINIGGHIFDVYTSYIVVENMARNSQNRF